MMIKAGVQISQLHRIQKVIYNFLDIVRGHMEQNYCKQFQENIDLKNGWTRASILEKVIQKGMVCLGGPRIGILR